jgi:uncharacterized damage-inducible protein DinB
MAIGALSNPLSTYSARTFASQNVITENSAPEKSLLDRIMACVSRALSYLLQPEPWIALGFALLGAGLYTGIKEITYLAIMTLVSASFSLSSKEKCEEWVNVTEEMLPKYQAAAKEFETFTEAMKPQLQQATLEGQIPLLEEINAKIADLKKQGFSILEKDVDVKWLLKYVEKINSDLSDPNILDRAKEIRARYNTGAISDHLKGINHSITAWLKHLEGKIKLQRERLENGTF